eukprot:m.339000 g.339000  ORF g.339000 m.339000 type:complete len:268 (-) comp18628_c0_seq1:1244-2047(-)
MDLTHLKTVLKSSQLHDRHDAVLAAIHSMALSEDLHGVEGCTETSITDLGREVCVLKYECGKAWELPRASSCQVLMKAVKVGDTLVINFGLSTHPIAASLDVHVADFVNNGVQLTDVNQLYSLNLGKLAEMYKTTMQSLKKSIVDSTVQGRSQDMSATWTTDPRAPRDYTHPFDPLAVGRIGQEPSPLNIGSGDLNPFGVGSGMLMSPDQLMRLGRGRGRGRGGALYPGGPFPRYDPIFPGAPGTFGATDPDPDHLRPAPGNDDYYS